MTRTTRTTGIGKQWVFDLKGSNAAFKAMVDQYFKGAKPAKTADSGKTVQPSENDYARLEDWTIHYYTDSKGHAQCVQTPEGSFLETVLCGKIRDNLWMEKFKPDATGKVNFVEDSGRQIIRTGARSFEWVAQLKPAHAQRLATR